MTHKQSTACDGPNCGKDITEGDGVRWRLIAQGESIPMKPSSLAKPHASASPHQHHFCGFKCLATWADDRQDKIDAGNNA